MDKELTRAAVSATPRATPSAVAAATARSTSRSTVSIVDSKEDRVRNSASGRDAEGDGEDGEGEEALERRRGCRLVAGRCVECSTSRLAARFPPPVQNLPLPSLAFGPEASFIDCGVSLSRPHCTPSVEEARLVATAMPIATHATSIAQNHPNPSLCSVRLPCGQAPLVQLGS